ncbi:protein ubiquitination [Trichomonas vaginalis G3]|uniref:protein ubiquitination n=1 Tax=Trichomonas vaginalis (strain ATCC PRA-98 / G3) TaxID=412133 RepID=UPI0021E571C6|nr:protein ubiquitination [Trichomonas vaginalis G3]KAI5522219.1 protein ubiquitination [Trichomonas vaginalis G3]
MSSSEPKNENWRNYSDLKPINVFEYPDQASKIIWGINCNNIIQISSQIIELITTHKIPIQMALYFIDIFSQIRIKEIKLFSELYQKILNAFSYIYKPQNNKLATLLHYQGFKFENFEPIMKEEKILKLYSTESPLYYIAWDKVNDLKSKFPNLDINQEINDITPLDCANKYGSELCFNYLKNLGADYTNKSEKYAVQGGNKNIFMQMIEEGKSFDNMINTALDYRNYEIAEYLKSNLRQTPDSMAESMYFCNYSVASCLISNGADINKIYNLFLFILIIVL